MKILFKTSALGWTGTHALNQNTRVGKSLRLSVQLLTPVSYMQVCYNSMLLDTGFAFHKSCISAADCIGQPGLCVVGSAWRA